RQSSEVGLRSCRLMGPAVYPQCPWRDRALWRESADVGRRRVWAELRPTDPDVDDDRRFADASRASHASGRHADGSAAGSHSTNRGLWAWWADYPGESPDGRLAAIWRPR